MEFVDVSYFVELNTQEVTTQFCYSMFRRCVPGITQKQVKNLRATEPVEHTFGTAISWKRESTIRKFNSYHNKLELIVKNVIENDIIISTSNKCFMTSFKGFANVVRNIQTKPSKRHNEQDAMVSIFCNHNIFSIAL